MALKQICSVPTRLYTILENIITYMANFLTPPSKPPLLNQDQSRRGKPSVYKKNIVVSPRSDIEFNLPCIKTKVKV